MKDVAEPSGIEDPTTEPDRRILFIVLGVAALGAVAALLRSRSRPSAQSDAPLPGPVLNDAEFASEADDAATADEPVDSGEVGAAPPELEPAPVEAVVEAPPGLYDDPLSVRERRAVPRR